MQTMKGTLDEITLNSSKPGHLDGSINTILPVQNHYHPVQLSQQEALEFGLTNQLDTSMNSMFSLMSLKDDANTSDKNVRQEKVLEKKNTV